MRDSAFQLISLLLVIGVAWIVAFEVISVSPFRSRIGIALQVIFLAATALSLLYWFRTD